MDTPCERCHERPGHGVADAWLCDLCEKIMDPDVMAFYSAQNKADQASLTARLGAAERETRRLKDQLEERSIGDDANVTAVSLASMGFRYGQLRAGLGADLLVKRAAIKGRPAEWFAYPSNPFGGSIRLRVMTMGQIRQIVRVLSWSVDSMYGLRSGPEDWYSRFDVRP